jgi:aspartate racemase
MRNQLLILGGMGPQASLRLHELLLEQSRKFHDGAPDSYPAILHASMQIPDFIASPDMTKQAVQIIRQTCTQLPLDTASAIGLACNTAHLLLNELPLSRDNFVSMIEAVANDITELGRRSVGLLASPYTIQTKIYENILRSHGHVVILPSEKDIEELNTIIHSVIAGHDPQQLRTRLTAVASTLERFGADTILLGCTELPLVGVRSQLPVVDSLASLAAAMLRKTNKIKV